MNKLSSKASSLSAIVALIVVGGGAIPAHAEWIRQEALDSPVNLTMRATSAFVDFTDTTNRRTDYPTSTSAEASAYFIWEPEPGAATPPNQTSVTHTFEITGGRTTYIDPATYGPTNSLCYIGVNGSNYVDAKQYDYRANPPGVKQTTFVSIPLPATKQEDVTFFYNTGIAKYTLTAKFPTSLECSSGVDTSYMYADAQGMHNYGQATANTTASSVNSVSVTTNP